MSPTEKIMVLNKASEKIREAIKEIDEVYKGNQDVAYFIWKINKLLLAMHQVIAKALEKDITDDEFNQIVKHLREEN